MNIMSDDGDKVKEDSSSEEVEENISDNKMKESKKLLQEYHIRVNIYIYTPYYSYLSMDNKKAPTKLDHHPQRVIFIPKQLITQNVINIRCIRI